MGKRGMRYVINDSWEAGSQNWTDDMIDQFKKRRGYDPVPWMPVLAGQVVESAEASDQFLWDFRKTIADLIADEHYGQLEATLHEWRHGALWRIARERARVCGRWHGSEEVQRGSHERDVDAAAGRQQGAVRLQRGRSRVGVGGAHLRAESGCGGVDDGGGVRHGRGRRRR